MVSDEAQEHVVVSELEAEAARRERAPESLSALIDERVLGERNGDVGTSWRTLRTWLAVNGSTERAHTTGVFVEPPRVPGAPPALVVYVDTKACEVDFRANAEVYLARLDAAGARFSRVTFRQDRRGRSAVGAARPAASRPSARVLPELSEEEETKVAALVANLPKGLRESVSRAMRMSLRREKLSDS